MDEITKIEMKELNMLSNQVVGACIEVHRILGPGLLEAAYEECVCHELRLRNIVFDRQVQVPIAFKGVQLTNAFRLDILVEKRLIVELKAVDELEPIHIAQLSTYLKLTGLHLGLLMNFNVKLMKHGIRRLINGQIPIDPVEAMLAEELRQRWEARDDK